MEKTAESSRRQWLVVIGCMLMQAIPFGVASNIQPQFISYVVEGEGKFIIHDEEYKVKKGDIIEIPKNTEFTYVGKMKLLFISAPAYEHSDFIDGRLNEI